MPEQKKRIRIGDFEFVAEHPPPRQRGNGSPKVAATALRAMDELGVDSVLVLCDASPSFVTTQNRHAKAEGVPVKFLSRNPHQNGSGKVCDVYAVRVTEAGA